MKRVTQTATTEPTALRSEPPASGQRRSAFPVSPSGLDAVAPAHRSNHPAARTGLDPVTSLRRSEPPVAKRSSTFPTPHVVPVVPARIVPGTEVVDVTFERRDWYEPELREAWRALADRSDAIHALYGSPAWFDHRDRTEVAQAQELCVATVRASGAIVGVVPFAIERRELEFSASTYSLFKLPMRSAVLLGGVPMLPDLPSVYDRLFGAMAMQLRCDCIDMSMVPTDGFAFRHLSSSAKVAEKFLFYTPEVQGAGQTHAIRMPATFEEYLSKFTSKKRGNLRRQVAALRKHGGDDMVLERFDSLASVDRFLEQAGRVAKTSWQREIGDQFEEGTNWPKKLADLAAVGVLRAYVLRVGRQPCAFALGMQQNGVFHYVKIGYDPAYAKLSPGTSLFYLILEDLYRARAPKRFCFCFGDSPYKREFANESRDTVEILLLRRTLKNVVASAAHATFRLAVKAAKQHLHKG